MVEYVDGGGEQVISSGPEASRHRDLFSHEDPREERIKGNVFQHCGWGEHEPRGYERSIRGNAVSSHGRLSGGETNDMELNGVGGEARVAHGLPWSIPPVHSGVGRISRDDGFVGWSIKNHFDQLVIPRLDELRMRIDLEVVLLPSVKLGSEIPGHVGT